MDSAPIPSGAHLPDASSGVAGDPSDPLHPPDLLWQAVAGMGQALGASSRLHLLAILAQGPRTVGELAGISGQAVPAASAQLQVLKRAGLVMSEREGRAVRYRHASPQVTELLERLRRTAEALMPSVRQIVDDVLRDPDALAPLTVDELEDELAAGRIVLLDVRTEGEFAAGHLPGAVNLPSAAVAHRLDEVRAMLRTGGRVVAYCRGPYCVTAVNAVERLRRHGVDATRLEFGTADWTASGRSLARPAGGGSRETSA